MFYKTIQILLILGIIYSVILLLFSINEYEHDNYKQKLILYGINVEKFIGNSIDNEDSTELKRELEKSGFKNIVAEISEDTLYGEVTIFIEATPPTTMLDRLLYRNVKPIWIQNTLMNTKL